MFVRFIFCMLVPFILFSSLNAQTVAWAVFKELVTGVAVNLITDVVKDEIRTENDIEDVNLKIENLEKRLKSFERNQNYTSFDEFKEYQSIIDHMKNFALKISHLEGRVGNIEAEVTFIKDQLFQNDTDKRLEIENVMEKNSSTSDPSFNDRRISFRAIPNTDLDELDLKLFLKNYNIFDYEFNEDGLDFPNDFKNLENNIGVKDRMTGLTWLRFESKKCSSIKEVHEFIKSLNAKKAAGYSDWRLPTTEELATLSKYDHHSLDHVFEDYGGWFWSMDQYKGKHWIFYSDSFELRTKDDLKEFYKSATVKPVRSDF